MESGEVLGGRYRLAAPLGHGGTAVVWRARDELLGREVAVKLLDDRLAGDDELARRLRDEARAAARLHHPHVVTVYDVGDATLPDRPPMPYAVLELVAGQSLSDILGDGPLPWRKAVRVCAEVAAGLAAAHAHGIVHRDVKPENVMLTGGGAKLVDFGISATIGEVDAGPDGELLCTPAYLAPERLTAGPVRAACDVYGLGLVLYKALTGRLPWREAQGGVAELIAARRRDAPAPLPPIPGLPAEVAALGLRCLAPRPEQRPSSAEAARVLAACAGTTLPQWSGPVPPEPAPTRPWRAAVGHETAPTAAARADSQPRPADRRPRAVALAAGMLVVAGVLFGFRTLDASRTVDGGGAPAGPGAEAAAGAAPPVACQVRYDVREDDGSEFAAGLTIINTGAAPVADWRLDFEFPADQRVAASSAAGWQQSGQSVTVDGGFASTLGAGESVSVDFEGSYRGENPLPTGFRLNGTECPHLLTVALEQPAPGHAGDGPASRPDDGPAAAPDDHSGPGHDGGPDDRGGPGHGGGPDDRGPGPGGPGHGGGPGHRHDD